MHLPTNDFAIANYDGAQIYVHEGIVKIRVVGQHCEPLQSSGQTLQTRAVDPPAPVSQSAKPWCMQTKRP